MCSGFAGSTSMSGSLFGNGPSQSRFVFAPPLGRRAVERSDGSLRLCLSFRVSESAIDRAACAEDAEISSSSAALPVTYMTAANRTLPRRAAVRRSSVLAFVPPLS